MESNKDPGHLDLSWLHDLSWSAVPKRQDGLKVTVEASQAADLIKALRWRSWSSLATVFWAGFFVLLALSAWETWYRLGNDPNAIAWVERKYPGKTIAKLPNWPISLVKKAFSPSGPGWPDDLPPPDIVLSDVQLQNALDRMTSNVGNHA